MITITIKKNQSYFEICAVISILESDLNYHHINLIQNFKQIIFCRDLSCCNKLSPQLILSPNLQIFKRK